MTDTQYKVTSLDLDPGEALSLAPLRPNTLMTWAALRDVGAAQDGVCAGSRRVIGTLGVSGNAGFHVPASGAPVQQIGSHSFPDRDTWRTAGWIRCNRLTPGCFLRARILAVGSGNTQWNSTGTTWDPAGPFGAIRLTASWVAGGSSDGPDDYDLELPSSTLENAAAPSDDAGMWAAAQWFEINEIRPSIATAANLANFSEDLEAEIEVQHRGAARIVQVVLYEEPVATAYLHSDTGPHAVNGQSTYQAAQTTVPQETAADGATYNEERFGTHRLLRTAQRQQEAVGPVVFDLQAWDEGNQDDNTDVEPISISSTSLVNIQDTSSTAYDRGLPGYVVGASHAQVHYLCDKLLFRTGEIWAPTLETLYDPRTNTTGTNDGTTYDETLRDRVFGSTSDDIQWSSFYDINGSPFTMMGWFEVDNLATERRPWLAQNSGASFAVYPRVFTTGAVGLRHENDAGTSMARTSATGVVVAGTRVFLAWTYDGLNLAAGVRIYADGTEVSYTTTTDGTGTPRNTQGSFGLSYSLSTSVAWLGSMSEVRAFDRVLTPVEIANYYNAALNEGGSFTGTTEEPNAMTCVVPGRSICEARLTGSATEATVRVQSGEFEWVDHTVTSTSWTALEATGYFETQVTPDHAWGVLQVFAQVDADTVEIRNVSAVFGE